MSVVRSTVAVILLVGLAMTAGSGQVAGANVTIDQGGDNGNDAPDSIYEQLNEDGSIVSYEYDAGSETVEVTMYSKSNGTTFVLSDGMAYYAKDGGNDLPIEDVTLDKGETRTITMSATSVKGYQSVGAMIEGDYDSATVLKNEKKPFWEDEPAKWDYVGVFGGSIAATGVIGLIIAALYISYRRNREVVNSYDRLHERD